MVLVGTWGLHVPYSAYEVHLPGKKVTPTRTQYVRIYNKGGKCRGPCFKNRGSMLAEKKENRDKKGARQWLAAQASPIYTSFTAVERSDFTASDFFLGRG